MECFNCRTLICCPDHCCDWDNCKCGDCESCGGEGERKPEPMAEEKKELEIKAEIKPVNEDELSVNEIIQIRVQQRMKEIREQEAKEQKEFDEKRAAEKARHDKILEESRETIERNKKILESTQGTLERLQNTIQGIKDTEKKFQDFQDAFGKVMTTALEKCFGSGENLEEMVQSYGQPKESSIEEVAEILSKSNHIAFIIGAGVSAESGVFTYKDNEETWEIEGTQVKISEVFDLNVLQSSPLEFWQAFNYNRLRIFSCGPNSVHYSITDLLNFYRNIGKKVSVLTQNFDGFERQLVGQDPDLFEICGNVNEMRCLFECGDDVFPCFDMDDMLYSIPLCPICSAIARPNVFLTGENFTEKFYRADSAADALGQADALVVLGTALNRDFVLNKVREFAKEGKVIVEVNVEPVISYGNVLVLHARCGEVVPPIVEVLKSIVG